MQKILPAADWTPVSMRLILHGRQICIARKPQCEICAIAEDCLRIGVGKRSKQSPSRIRREA
jgi:endonuclease III